MLFKAASGESEDSKNYIRLKDGENVTGVFAGDIYEFAKHWVNNRSEVCKGDSCPLCKSSGKRGSFRFRINLIVRGSSGAYEAKIFEQGWKVYKNLRDLNEEYPLEHTIVKITRQGSQMNDTTYSVLPVKDGLVKPPQAALIKAVQLIDLRHVDEKAESPAPPQEAEPLFNEEDIPF